ncbi:hypothetical protein GGD66_002506 [Bradyrhizobium sp. CIR48]|uniref:metallophosphoesterase family protein n=1 Tax=Bradyrhizobium sp. CIR48 TaxID=2663840 RepID=UPI0016068DA9|nr:metallophosphoesterase [Bradyrhizobium sp. CIR48]MBB4423962.1 hypothetical protein [Bradyrhizobium sp. CIR48]
MTDQMPTFRDHFLSIFQSAAAQYERTTQTDVVEEGLGEGQSFAMAAAAVAAQRVQQTVEPHSDVIEEGFGDIARVCSALGLRYLEALVTGDEAGAALLAEQMEVSTCDPKWGRTLREYSEYFGWDGTRRQIPYLKPTEASRPIEIKTGATIALFGDWAAGTKTARKTLESIRAFSPDILVHLGDIYYSGTEAECAVNFDDVIEDVFDRKNNPLPVFTLAGNHDMYSGGIAYYDLIRRLNRGRQSQISSFFCLRSSDAQWQLLAMDTGLHDYSPLSVGDALTFVEKEEQAWLEARVAEFDGKSILLSHHQLFSAFSKIGKPAADGRLTTHNPNLLSLFKRLKSTGRSISAWFWGHEHNLCIYQPHLDLERGRCIGHGAVPIFEGENPYQLLEEGVDPPLLIEGTKLKVEQGVYEHGFAILRLGKNGSLANVDYVANGRVIFTESF